MGYFKFIRQIHICDSSCSRIQPYIINLETNELKKPVITIKNKAFNSFWNNSISKNGNELYFTATLIDTTNGLTKSLRNVKFYNKDDFINEFAEYII